MENKSIQILNEIKKVIVGKDEVITKTLMAILAGGHVGAGLFPGDEPLGKACPVHPGHDGQ